MKQLEFAGSEDWNTTLTFVGNATMIIRTAAGTLLTDPSFLHAGDHVHLGYGVRARRRLEPALQPADLPPLDAVLLSHLHGDHWDAPAERALSRSLPIITTMRAASVLRRRGFGATHGLKTWQKLRCRKGEASLTITAVPAQHGPKAVAMLLPQTNGYTLETLRGDTLLFAGLHEIPKRFRTLTSRYCIWAARAFHTLASASWSRSMRRAALKRCACYNHRPSYRFTPTTGQCFRRRSTTSGTQCGVRGWSHSYASSLVVKQSPFSTLSATLI